MAQYSPNPSPMVPEPAGLPPESTPVRPPAIPHQHSGSPGGPSPPAWAQYQSMNAYPQGYPTGTPYHPPQHAYTPLQPDWIGSASGWNPNLPPVTPYNGPQPHTGFNAFQQPLPGGGPPPGFPPGGWGGAPPPAGGGQWGVPPTPAGPVPGWGTGAGGGWGGWGPAQPTTPWTGGGGGGPHPWAQPPAPIVPQPTGGGPGGGVAAMRDRSNEGLDLVDRFATGPHYGPVLTPLLLRIVGAQLKVNPLMTAPTQDLDQVYLRWNMLFSASHCTRSDDRPDKSWSNGRSAPATHPRLTEIKIISRSFPWIVTVYAADPNAGVTCGEIIDRLDDFLHKNLRKEDADLDSGNHRVERDHAYYHNRSTAIGVPGGRLGEGLRRLDWLCKDTMFGGLEVNNAFVTEFFGGASPPGILTLMCTTRYPLTEQELDEQKAREREEDERIRAAEDRARAAEARAAELEERERRRMRKRSRSRAGSVHSRHSSARGHVSTDEDSEED